MAIEIDYTRQFTQEEVQFLRDRDRWRELRDNYEEFGGEKPVLPLNTPQTGPESAVNQLGPTGLTADQERESREAAEQLLAGDSGGEPIDYEKLTVKELRAELEARRATAATEEETANLEYGERDNKATLIARLDKDDELVESRSA